MTALDRIPLNVLLGVPRSEQHLVRAAPDGRQLLRVEDRQDPNQVARLVLRPDAKGGGRVMLLGMTNIAPYLSPERFALLRLYLQPNVQLRLSLGPGAILNQIADPDICAGPLELAARLVKQTSRSCFNAPEAVARTTRDGTARALTGIPGLDVPKTIRVEAPTPQRVRDAIAQAGLAYPVLLRLIGAHGGLSLSKVDDPASLDSVVKHIGLYVSEFRDFKDTAGRYRKFRVVIIGDDIVLRHCIIGDQWRLKASRRAQGTEQSERAMFDAFDRDWSKQLRHIFREIGARLRLDYFGVDCCIDDNGEVLLFEANAGMNILQNTSPSPNMWDAPIVRIKNALEERLASPWSWHEAAA